MSFTIAVMEDLAFDVVVDFSKSGNKFVVGMHSNELNEYTYSRYDTREEAVIVFNQLSNAILMGEYSYKQRREMIVGKL